MQLCELLKDIPYTIIKGNDLLDISDISMNSKEEQKNKVFVCIHGATVNGHTFIKEVLDKGAAAVIVDEEVDMACLASTLATILRVKDTMLCYPMMCCAYFHYPSKQLITIGITGTKGKTTTAYMLHAMLNRAELKTGLIGTIEAIIGEERIPTRNTTPDSYTIQKYLAKMVAAGCRCVVMEVSSQGLKYERTAGILFDYGIFTNLEEDHIGPKEHADMKEYIACKAKLFRQCKVGIINTDDARYEQVIQSHTCKIVTYGLRKGSDLSADRIEKFQRDNMLGVRFNTRGTITDSFELSMPGEFNVYNALAAILLCSNLSIPVTCMKDSLVTTSIKGRMEIVAVPLPCLLIIDYAHNALSLKSLLETLRGYYPKRIVLLFGCGGNRSKVRRYEMGEIAAKLADLTVITSDNPREEDPMDIIKDITIGMNKGMGTSVMICDRVQAIAYCLTHVKEGDFIVLAGKGHEVYQEIKGKQYPMDERVIVKQILSKL